SQTSGGGGGADNRSIERALQWVINNRTRYNIVAVNMSLGSGFYTSPAEVNGDIYRDEITTLENAGVTIVSAAGNTYGVVRDSSGQQFNLQFANSASPGIVSTLNVGAVWETNEGGGFYWSGGNTVDLSTGPDRVVSFSQRPPPNVGNAIFAPGAVIQSTWPNNQLHETQGTSMASPMVAGAVALMQDASLTFGGRLLSPVEVRDILLQTGDTIIDGDDEDDALFIDANGNGTADPGEVTSLQNTGNSYKRINVYNAVRFIRDQFGGAGSVPAGDPSSVIAGAIAAPALNGSPLDAIEGVLGRDGNVTVGNRDVDLYRFTVSVAGEVTIEVAPSLTNPNNFNSYLRLFRANGTQLAADDNSGAGDYSLIKRQLTPGTYFAGVSGTGNDSYNIIDGTGRKPGKQGNFRLGLSLKNVDPNGILGGAVPVSLTAAGEAPQVFNGFIGADFGKVVGVSDVDLFRIVVPDAGTLLIDVDTPFDNQFVDSFLRVFDENGVQLAADDDGFAVNVNGAQVEFDGGAGIAVDSSNTAIGHTSDSFVSGTVSRGEVYYIGVSDFQNQTYNPTNLSNRTSGGTGGFYNLSIAFVSNDRNGSIEQAVEISSLPLTNLQGFIGTDDGNTIEVGDRDVDILKIRPTTDGILEIRADSFDLAGNPNPLDTLITLFDGGGTRLAQLDDTSTSGDPVLRISVPKNRDYYAAFSAKGNDSFNPFILGSGASGATGQYRINIQMLGGGVVAGLSDDTITSGAVRTVSLGTTIAASIGYDDTLVRGDADVDLYRFVAPANGLVELRAFTQNAFGADTFLRLFNANGSLIASNDNDGADTVNSRIQFSATSGTVYFIGVSGKGNSSYNASTGAGATNGSGGNYVLSVDGQFASLTGKTAHVAGTGGNDRIRVRQRGADIGIVRGNGELRFSDTSVGSFSIIAGAGNDVVTLDAGIDEVAYIDGGDGNDSIVGGDGADTITGGAGKNTLDGAAGDDRVNGSGGRDLIFGGAGNDRLYGNGGSDTIDGGGNVDRIFGGDGDDRLIGASSNDKLYGQAGNDTLIGGAGSDLLDGGSGTDLADDDNADSRTSIEGLL
ncbi:MAG TPA: pre-peptidase C-terminal domain-containing protein, partial [Tepidisphaeraceae bacterium]|nr:pre-peptidase C-terminal domain-containing protein [Tepidisphaeraceae bacterium]